MILRKIILIAITLVNCYLSFSQNSIYQTVKGTVRDKDSQLPLPGAFVLVNSGSQIGTSADSEGNFKLEKVPLGRQTIIVSFIGYEPYIIKELLVSSGKEVVINIELKESATELKEITVKPKNNKEQPLNQMALVSAKQVSVEEANRYAGGFDDPARLVTAFAGVAGNLQSNGIVIRGNSPMGVLWKMEGVEISNPSHFAYITGFGGGGITALSSQMLANSDFFTSAFPAEYGNALSGVFDLKLRNGNNDRTEFTAQAGIIGLDFSAEGPFSKGGKSSYLFNYRYSTFSLLGPLLPPNASGIRFQDICFKLNFPTSKAGTFSLWGIGALDKNPQVAESDSSLWQYEENMQKGTNNLNMGAVALEHRISLSQKGYILSSVSVSGNGLAHEQFRYNNSLTFDKIELVDYYNWKYSLSTLVNYKFNARHTNKTGVIFDNLNYNYNLQNAEVYGNPLKQIIKANNNSSLIQLYSESKINVSEKLSLNAGLHSQYFSLNKNYTIEPRLGLSLKISPKHTISLGYGSHSKLDMLQIYYIEGSSGHANKNLDFSKAHHFVASFDWSINENLHLKIEPYYQKLYSLPVIPGQSFSIININKDWFLNDSLINKGTGINTGADLTFERFLDNGFYYLATVSLFNSKYSGGDNIERNSKYNKNYVFNILGGKEWILRNSKILSANARINFMGGDRYTPIINELSIIAKAPVYDESRAFSAVKPNVWYVDFTLNYKINRPRYSSTISLKLINILGTKEYYDYRYNYKKGIMEMESDANIVPNLSYKIEF